MAARNLTSKQMDALRALNGHGNTMQSLVRHGLIMRGRGGRGWTRRYGGELVLAGWSMAGIRMLRRPVSERGWA